MTGPTAKDISNAQKYANQRLNLLKIRKMYYKFPHITSWLKYEVVEADKTSHYYYPKKLKSRAIFVKTEITKTLCEDKLSCNQFTGIPHNDGICPVDRRAGYYRVGDGGKEGNQIEGIHYDINCQPACYHLKERTSPNDNDLHSPPLRYHNNKCTIINPSLLKWMEFPYFRSETIYEHRVNDLPAGFNRSESSSKTVSGLNYEYNKIYCDSFFDKFDESTKKCYTPWYEIVGSAIVGEYIIKLCKSSIRSLNNENWNDLPSTADLPKVPSLDLKKKKMDLQSWYNDINKDFKPPGPDIHSSDDASKLQQGQKKLDENVRSHRRRRQAEAPSAPVTAKDPFIKIFMHFLKMFLDPKMYRDIGIFIGAEVFAKSLKKLSVYMTKELGPKLFAKFMETKMMTSVFGDVIKTVVEHISVSLVNKISFNLISRIAFLLNPLTAVLDWFMILSMIMDVILTIVDPLNLNKKYPDNFLQDLILSSEEILKKQYNTVEPVINFEIFVHMLLTDEDVGDINLNTWRYVNEYLDALEFNSEGQPITDHVEDTHQVIINYYENNQHEIEKVHLFNENDIELYEYDHLRRMKLMDKVKRAYWISGIGLITTITFQRIIIAYVFIILISILMYMQYLVAEIEDITDIESYFKWF